MEALSATTFRVSFRSRRHFLITVPRFMQPHIFSAENKIQPVAANTNLYKIIAIG